MKAMSKSPYSNPGIFVRVGRTSGSVWSWDADEITGRLGIPARRLCPETALHAAQDGLVLRECLDGYEGQYWQEGELRLSRWWSHAVDDRDWKLFGLAAETLGGRPTPKPAPIPGVDFSQSLSANQLSFRDLSRHVGISEIMVVVALLAIIPSTYIIARSAYLLSAEVRTERSVAELRTSQAPLRLATLRKAELEQKITTIHSILNRQDLLQGVAPALAHLRDSEAEISTIFFESGEVEIIFRVDGRFQPTELIRALEQDPAIEGVTIEPEARQGLWRVVYRMAEKSYTG